MKGKEVAAPTHSFVDQGSQEPEPTPRKTALLFVGQVLTPQEIIDFYEACYNAGDTSFAQMGSASLLEERFRETQRAMDEINPKADFRIIETLSDPSHPAFNSTAFIQPVVYTLSVVAWKIAQKSFADQKIAPTTVAGHSLGEFAALTAANVLSFKDGVRAVAYRGKVMQQDCEENPSSLYSLLGADETQAQEAAEELDGSIALKNAPNLIAIGVAAQKPKETVEEVTKRHGARRVTYLERATGAFHTKFMNRAAEKLADYMKGIRFENTSMDVVLNRTAAVTRDGNVIREKVGENVSNPVRWHESLKTMADQGVELFIELGPGSTLKSLNGANKITVPTTNFQELQAA